MTHKIQLLITYVCLIQRSVIFHATLIKGTEEGFHRTAQIDLTCQLWQKRVHLKHQFSAWSRFKAAPENYFLLKKTFRTE